MPQTASWTLTIAEARAHVETLNEAMDLLTRRYPDRPTALLYGRLRDLRELLERGAEEVPALPADHWGRPWICGECGDVLQYQPMLESPGRCVRCRWLLLRQMDTL